MMILGTSGQRAAVYLEKEKLSPYSCGPLSTTKDIFHYHKLDRDKDYIKYLMVHREVPLANNVYTAKVAEAHRREVD